MVFPEFTLRPQKGAEKMLQRGMPWLLRSDVVESSEMVVHGAGALVEIVSAKGAWLGIGYVNAASHITCRVLTRKKENIDEAFFMMRLQRALEKREKLIGTPYYRLVHSEGDCLPGLLVDRFGDIVVCQIGTAGMERLEPLWLAALETLLKPIGIVLRNDVAARKLEGLKEEVRIVKGTIPALVELREYETRYLADVMRGQKTGWFYDQRDNRKMMAEMSAGKTVLDVYSHSGGFGIAAACAGAAQVMMVDSSALALELAQKNAALNEVEKQCLMQEGNAFEVMEALNAEGMRYDVVIADPPAFVKSRKDIAAGMKGYEKVARLAARLVAPGGVLYVASCSHHATRPAFVKAVKEGVSKAGRSGEVVAQTGAAPDHPVHPQLPQGEYLKAVVMRLN